MKLRPYQQNAVESTELGWGTFRKQLGVLPTGGGKTVVFSHLAARQPGRTLILAHREELLEQAQSKLHASTGIRAEIEKAERHASRDARVVVASVQSLIGDNRRESWAPDHFNLVVVDEAHHALSDSYRKVLSRFDGHARVLGVTATPDRGDKRNLGEYFEAIPFEVGLFDLVKAGYLAPITLKSVPLEIDLSNVKQLAGDFSDSELGTALEPYLQPIAQAIKRHASFRRVLAFLPLIATSRKFVEACQGAGLAAEHVDGTSEDRTEILARFAAGGFDVLSNAMLLTEGYDDPGIDCVVVLRPTRSRPLYAQMVGRGTRIHETKDNLLLLDFLWMHDRHSVVRPAHLIAKSDDEAKSMMKMTQGNEVDEWGQEEFDLQDLQTDAVAEREEALRKQLDEHSKRQSRYMSAEDYAASHGGMDIADYEPTMKWEQEPASAKQLAMLKRNGIDISTVSGKGHASQLISLIVRGEKLVMATPAQRATMKRMGAPFADRATAQEARQFFATKNKKKEVYNG